MESFNNILEERRQENSNFLWVSRELNTDVAYKQYSRPNPKIHKKQVLHSQKIKEIILKFSSTTGTTKEEVEHEVKLILDEIGFNKQLKVIRWLGLVLTKICQKVCSGIYVNEESICRLKSRMGNCPVIFAPTHRSYADFILMSYVCFTYNIEIPAIAAGMDFHAMWGMGSVLRDTGAFFMRRSYNDDFLYWETFKQYVHQIVTFGDLPVEFFIEGTRSRSCKSLIPKLGLLSMMLKPLFTGEIPDVLIVPINISYDRVLEEKLFAFELLGIPKPKESTSGFFKSLSILKENYGNIYVDFTTPISVKQYFGERLDRSAYAFGPLHHLQLSLNDRQLISDLGYEIQRVQRDHTTLSTFNLVAVALTVAKINSFAALVSEISWLRDVLQQLGAQVALGSLTDALHVHSALVIDEGSKIELVHSPIVLDNIKPMKLKGYRLSNETMSNIIPLVMLQLYVNPCLYYFVNNCLIAVSLLAFSRFGQLSKDTLFGHFQFLRTIFSYEFVFNNKMDKMEYEDTLNKMSMLNVIEFSTNDAIVWGNNEKLQLLFINLLRPFISAYYCLLNILKNVPETTIVEHTDILTEAQKQLENALCVDTFMHPYCLNLDTLTMCLQSLTSMGALQKYREENKQKYKTNQEEISLILKKIERISTSAKIAQKSKFSFHHNAKL